MDRQEIPEMLRVFMPLLVLSLTTPAIAADPQLSRQAAPVPAAPPVKEKKICREEVATGSIMPRQTCHTQAEWQAMSDGSSAYAERMRKDQNAHQAMQAQSGLSH